MGVAKWCACSKTAAPNSRAQRKISCVRHGSEYTKKEKTVPQLSSQKWLYEFIFFFFCISLFQQNHLHAAHTLAQHRICNCTQIIVSQTNGTTKRIRDFFLYCVPTTKATTCHATSESEAWTDQLTIAMWCDNLCCRCQWRLRTCKTQQHYDLFGSQQ